MLRHWSPKESHFMFKYSFISSFIIHSCEKHCFKPKICKEGSISWWMSKSIYHPSNFRSNIEFFLQKSVSLIHIQYHVFIIRASFISWWPSSLKEFELAIFNKLLDFILLFLCLGIIPHCKEFHFSISELSPAIFKQFVNSSIYNWFYLSSFRASNEIFFNCLDPSYIIMAMWNQMNSKMLMLVSSCDYFVYRR